MKKVLLLLITTLTTTAPLCAAVTKPLETKVNLDLKPSYKRPHVYLGVSPLMSVTPGIRARFGQYGVDINATLRPYLKAHNVNVSGLIYLNKYDEDRLQHYLSLGGGIWLSTRFSDNEAAPASLLAYGFERQLEGDGYLFMNFGVYSVFDRYGPIPFPLLNVGYAF